MRPFRGDNSISKVALRSRRDRGPARKDAGFSEPVEAESALRRNTQRLG